MSFDDRVAAVGIATQFQESSKDVFKMVEEETEFAKTQVLRHSCCCFCFCFCLVLSKVPNIFLQTRLSCCTILRL